MTTHPFLTRPRRTFFTLSVPVLLSLLAEPLTGLVDTAFVARLGSEPLAALGVGTVMLSSVFWIFNFLGIGTQTEVAQALGDGRRDDAIRLTSLALVLSAGFGLLMIVVFWPLSDTLAALLGAEGTVRDLAGDYIAVRLLGGPAVLITLTGFGALRGMQDMRMPLWIAGGVNALNIALDGPMIFGVGAWDGFGVPGSALASAISQWIGAGWIIWAVWQRLGLTRAIVLREAVDLLKVGGDLFLRTGLLMAFQLLATRVATQIGPDSGAAHQTIRQVWFFTALMLEAFALTAQSLVGYFLGAAQRSVARQVAVMGLRWGVMVGAAVTALMLALTPLVIALMVPESAESVFLPAWIVSALSQPVTALAFVSDGIHWGTRDYRFLRNAMLAASATGVIGLLLIDIDAAWAFTWLWVVTTVWIAVRAGFGTARVWVGGLLAEASQRHQPPMLGL